MYNIRNIHYLVLKLVCLMVDQLQICFCLLIFKEAYYIIYLESCNLPHFHFFFMPPRRRVGGILIYPCPSIRIQIHGLSGYLLLQFWSYSFNIFQNVYTHNGGVHIHRILIFIKYSQNNRQLDLVILFVRPDIDTWFVRLSPPTVLELQL